MGFTKEYDFEQSMHNPIQNLMTKYPSYNTNWEQSYTKMKSNII